MTDYQILRQAAESGKRDDIDALGRWFEREGREFWNGEYYDADGMEIYPLYKLVDAEAGDYEIVGYTTDRAASIDSMKAYHVLPEFWSAWGEDVDGNTVIDMAEIERLAREWDMTVDALMEQVEEV